MALSAVLVLAAACGKTMSEEDCREVGGAMRAAWEAEAKQAAPAEGQAAENATAVVLDSEGKKLSSEWASDCRRELAGRAVDPRELACLTRAKTIAELSQCAEPASAAALDVAR